MAKRLLSPLIKNKQFIKNIRHILPDKEPVFSGKYIPVSTPSITHREIHALTKSVKKGFLSGNSPLIEEFESEFAKNISHTRYAIAVNSGTSALMVVMAMLDLKPGDEVIVPTFTFIGTVNMITLFGAKPILVDADPKTWNIDPSKIEACITPKTRAIIAVHIYGLACDMDIINALAKKHQLWVIEDAAEALGSEYKGKRTGSLSDVAIFSLYANKTITTGEGGIITTNNKKIADLAYSLRSHAFSPEKHFWHSLVGFGVRMTSLQASIGIAQVKRFEALLTKRLVLAQLYRDGLANIPGLTLPPVSPHSLNTHWMFSIIVDEKKFGMSKNDLRKILARLGIETRSFFIPAHLQPIYYQKYTREYPVSEYLCQNGLYLPTSPTLTKKEVAYICKCIIHAHGK